jgi:hypothetical protein
MRVLWRLVLLLVVTLVPSVRARAQPSFDEIVARLSRTTPAVRTFVADQVIDLRVLRIFRFRLHATVYAERPAHYRVVLRNPPVLLRSLGTVFTDATSPDRVLGDYRAVSLRQHGTVIVAELEGKTKAANPPSGRVVIDAERWVVTETLMRYPWGDVHAAYAYGEVQGHYLPVGIRFAAPAFALSADIRFENYRLNVPLPESLR